MVTLGSGTLTTYVDGSLEDTAPQGPLQASDEPFAVGNWRDSPGKHYMNGGMARLLVWGRVLTEALVADLYASERAAVDWVA